MNLQIGYCCNVHPGRSLLEVKQNLEKYSVAIKKTVSPQQPLGIGLWLSATTVSELRVPGQTAELKEWLADRGLFPFTINGFPFGDFHQAVVKHQVYLPDWANESRLNYTLELAAILNEILEPTNVGGSISTLPLGWPDSERPQGVEFFDACGDQLAQCAVELDRIRQASGRKISVCIEPEPGCLLDSSEDVVDFFENSLFRRHRALEPIIREHITVCHDVCHSSVMFEEQAWAIKNYKQAGIHIGKVQVSSAVRIDFDKQSEQDKSETISQLKTFNEPRYLHQTVWKGPEKDSQPILFEDLSLFLAATDQSSITGSCRVHFHVPIFADRLGMIETTQAAIVDCLNALFIESSHGQALPATIPEHFEIETYAWNVLPTNWQPASLVDGISREWIWFEEQLKRVHLLRQKKLSSTVFRE